MYLYKSIGERIREYRKSENLKQDEFVANLDDNHKIIIDRSKLSHIENGRTYPYKNPYLLTTGQIEGISEYMQCDPKELIFGNDIEREESVKLFLLAIIMNSEKDKEDEYVIPFMDFLFGHKNSSELRKYINKRSNKSKNGTMNLKENKEKYIRPSTVMNGLNKIEKIYPFFSSERIYIKYRNLLGAPSLRIELISNLLIKLLMGDIEFSNYYILKMSRLCEINGSNEVAYSFIENKGMIGGALIENKNNFYVFANAFEKMWKRHNELFMEYFEEHFFNKRIKPELKYKEINNKLFSDVIIDNKFSNLIFSTIEKDRFSIETMDGHYLFYKHLLNRYVDKEIEDSIENPN